MSEQKPSAEAMEAAVEAVKSLRMELHEQSRSTIKVAAVFALALDAFATRALAEEREAIRKFVQSEYEQYDENGDAAGAVGDVLEFLRARGQKP